MRFKIAIAQADSKSGDRAGNLRRAEASIKTAAEKGARIVLFPELYLTGYFLGPKLRELSEPPCGPSLRKVSRQAKEEQIAIALGFVERGKRSPRIYNSLAIFDPEDGLLGIQRKVHLCRGEKGFFTPGQDVSVFETEFGKVGLMICYDMYFPELPRLLALEGAQLLLVSSADWKPWQDTAHTLARARAIENELFLAYCNRVGSEGRLRFFGRSCLIDPWGRIVAGASEAERLILAEVDYDSIKRRRSDINYILDRRPQAYRIKSRKYPVA